MEFIFQQKNRDKKKKTTPCSFYYSARNVSSLYCYDLISFQNVSCSYKWHPHNKSFKQLSVSEGQWQTDVHFEQSEREGKAEGERQRFRNAGMMTNTVP